MPRARITPDFIARRLPIAAHDPHFAPQSAFCGGLGTTLDAYDHVIAFPNLTTGLLGVLREARYPQAALRLASKILDTPLKLFMAPESHMTNASAHRSSLSEEGRAAVQKFYRDDYRLLRSPPPARPAIGVAHTSDGKVDARVMRSIVHPIRSCVPASAGDTSYETCRLTHSRGGFSAPRCQTTVECQRCDCKHCGWCTDRAALQQLDE